MKPKYLRMVNGMASQGDACWSVYVLRCGDQSLYTGIAKDIEKRLKQHRLGRGAAYTRTHQPVELVYSESGLTRSAALIREVELKRLSKLAKENLVKGVIPASRS